MRVKAITETNPIMFEIAINNFLKEHKAIDIKLSQSEDSVAVHYTALIMY